MASKSGQPEAVKAEIEELLDYVDKTLDRVKVLYEQYFLGMQKQPPTHLHADVERRLRDLMQIQIRNTGLRYRFATLQQKFGSYNSYWRRTLRQIENGTYIRNLSKISRQAALTGEEIPEEILAAMPKRMREQVRRDREAVLAQQRRREGTVADDEFTEEPPPGAIGEITAARNANPLPRNVHVLDDSDEELDFDKMFASMTDDTQSEAPAFLEPEPVAPAPRPASTPSAPVRAAGIGVGRPSTPSGQMPVVRVPAPGVRASQSVPVVPPPPPGARVSQAVPVVPRPGPIAAPSQAARPNPIAPGSSQARPAVPVETMSGPFPRVTTPRPAPPPAPRPPPGMNDADVNALYANYVKAKQMVGENAGPGAYGKLLQTINAQAPKIMQQYKAKGVEFSVVVKDNQVIIKAKPKT